MTVYVGETVEGSVGAPQVGGEEPPRNIRLF